MNIKILKLILCLFVLSMNLSDKNTENSDAVLYNEITEHTLKQNICTGESAEAILEDIDRTDLTLLETVVITESVICFCYSKDIMNQVGEIINEIGEIINSIDEMIDWIGLSFVRGSIYHDPPVSEMSWSEISQDTRTQDLYHLSSGYDSDSMELY